MLNCLKGYRLIIAVPPLLFAALFTLLLFASNVSGQQNNTPKPEVKLPDYHGWILEKSEPVKHPTDKNLSAVVEKFKNPLADEWIILAKVSGKESGDSWQRTFFLRLKTKRRAVGLSSLEIFDLTFHDNKWFVDNSFAIKSNDDLFLYVWVDTFYDEFVEGLKKPDGIPSSVSSKRPVRI